MGLLLGALAGDTTRTRRARARSLIACHPSAQAAQAHTAPAHSSRLFGLISLFLALQFWGPSARGAVIAAHYRCTISLQAHRRLAIAIACIWTGAQATARHKSDHRTISPHPQFPSLYARRFAHNAQAHNFAAAGCQRYLGTSSICAAALLLLLDPLLFISGLSGPLDAIQSSQGLRRTRLIFQLQTSSHGGRGPPQAQALPHSHQPLLAVPACSSIIQLRTTRYIIILCCRSRFRDRAIDYSPSHQIAPGLSALSSGHNARSHRSAPIQLDICCTFIALLCSTFHPGCSPPLSPLQPPHIYLPIYNRRARRADIFQVCPLAAGAPASHAWTGS